jgi:hypothetical protein
MAHLGIQPVRSWGPVVGVVLPPLWHQGHKGQPMPRTAAGQRPQDRGRGHQAPVAAPTGFRTSHVGRGSPRPQETH